MIRSIRKTQGRRPAGFTLVEILIIVIILGILAAIALPQYRDVTIKASGANLSQNVAMLRAQIQVYRNQHVGYPDADKFAAQLTKCTDLQGNVADAADAGHPYGPYIEQMPANPISNQRTLRGVQGPSEEFTPPATDGGWWYNSTTGKFCADLTDARVDRDGIPFNQY